MAEVIKEVKTSNWAVRLVRRGSEIYLQYVTPLSEYEAKLYDIVKLIGKYCESVKSDCATWYRWHDKDISSVPPIFSTVVRVMKYIPVGEVPGWHVEYIEQVYSLCYRKNFYRIYVMRGGIWGDYRLWIVVAPPINNEAAESWCSYCRSEFC